MDEEARWRQLSRMTGGAGVVFTLLTLGPIVAMSGGEPAFDGEASAVLAYFLSTSSTLNAFGSFLVVVGIIAMVWFAIGLALLLARAEDRPPWRASIAAASALIFVGLTLNGHWEAASYRAETLTPALATYAFDMGNLGFANSWVALAVFLAAAGWIMLGTPSLPSWLGWVAIAAAVGFLVGRAVWTTPVWLIPYSIFWIWVVAVSIQLFRGRLPERAG